jgi:hypothetical protein
VVAAVQGNGLFPICTVAQLYFAYRSEIGDWRKLRANCVFFPPNVRLPPGTVYGVPNASVGTVWQAAQYEADGGVGALKAVAVQTPLVRLWRQVGVSAAYGGTISHVGNHRVKGAVYQDPRRSLEEAAKKRQSRTAGRLKNFRAEYLHRPVLCVISLLEIPAPADAPFHPLTLLHVNGMRGRGGGGGGRNSIDP